MSRFIDKLNRLQKNEPQPMGFMVSKAASEKPKLQLLVDVAAGNLEAVSEGLKSADAVVIEVTKADDAGAVESYCQAKDGVPGGSWLKITNGGTLKKLLNTTCDFVIFPCGAPVSVTQKEKLGRILELDSTFTEGMMRTACDLPVDAVLEGGKESETALTVSRLMQVQRALYTINKPLLVTVPDNAAAADLQTLWDMGVSGVVVEATDDKSSEKLTELRKAIDSLKPSKARRKGRASPILPQMQPEAPQPHEEGGGEEEDE